MSNDIVMDIDVESLTILELKSFLTDHNIIITGTHPKKFWIEEVNKLIQKLKDKQQQNKRKSKKVVINTNDTNNDNNNNKETMQTAYEDYLPPASPRVFKPKPKTIDKTPESNTSNNKSTTKRKRTDSTGGENEQKPEEIDNTKLTKASSKPRLSQTPSKSKLVKRASTRTNVTNNNINNTMIDENEATESEQEQTVSNKSRKRTKPNVEPDNNNNNNTNDTDMNANDDEAPSGSRLRLSVAPPITRPNEFQAGSPLSNQQQKNNNENIQFPRRQSNKNFNRSPVIVEDEPQQPRYIEDIEPDYIPSNRRISNIHNLDLTPLSQQPQRQSFVPNDSGLRQRFQQQQQRSPIPIPNYNVPPQSFKSPQQFSQFNANTAFTSPPPNKPIPANIDNDNNLLLSPAKQTIMEQIKQQVPKTPSALMQGLLYFAIRTTAIVLALVVLILIFDKTAATRFGLWKPKPFYCPTGVDPATIEGQAILKSLNRNTCEPCPENSHGFCNMQGQLICNPGYENLNNVECVISNELTKASQYYANQIINALQLRLGDYNCGLIPVDQVGLSPSALKEQYSAQMLDDYPNLQGAQDKLWEHTFHSLQTNEQQIVSKTNEKNEITEFQAIQPDYSLKCSIKLTIYENKLRIILSAMVISLITYVIIAIRLWINRRAQATNISNQIKSMLSRTPGVTHAIEHIRDHLRDQYKYDTSNIKLWGKVLSIMNSDSRIQLIRAIKGNVTRDCWVWIADGLTVDTTPNHNTNTNNDNNRNNNPQDDYRATIGAQENTAANANLF